jgi:predicted small lipoprotein YifL
MRRLVFCLVLLLAGNACGQKGPLYLSDSPPPGSQPSPSKAYKPVPYPERKADDAAPGAQQP